MNDGILITICSVASAVAVVLALFLHTPSMHLFELIGRLSSHGYSTRRR